MSLIWTKTVPTKAGWYWEWNFGYVRVVEVYKWTYFPKPEDANLICREGWECEHLWVTYPHTRSHPMPVGQAFAKDTMWAGPIEEPEKP